MKKIVLAIAFAASLILVIGSIGAFENDRISGLQCIIQCAIGVGIEWLALRRIENRGEM